MTVRSILKAKGARVATTRPHIPIDLIVRELKDRNIGALVVSEDGTTVLGIVSERDVVQGLAEQGPRLLDQPVSAIMTRKVVTCSPDDSVTKVMGQMTRYRVRHVPVLDGQRLAGIVSIGDVVKNRLDELETEAAILREAFLARH